MLAAPAASHGSTQHLVSVGQFDQPTDVVAPPGDAAAIYVVERPGVILRIAGAGVRTESALHVQGLSSFGQDNAGELYLASVDSGRVYRLAG